MSAIFEYFTLFDFFILAALIGILCCGLLDGETTCGDRAPRRARKHLPHGVYGNLTSHARLP